MEYYRKSSHSVYDSTCHIVWITKYHYPVLAGDIGQKTKEKEYAEIIRGKSFRKIQQNFPELKKRYWTCGQLAIL